MSTVSSLLEVEAGELADSLTGRVIAANRDVLRKMHNVKDAEIGRDALAKVGRDALAKVGRDALAKVVGMF